MANVMTLNVIYDAGGGPEWTEIEEGHKLYFQKAGAFEYGPDGAIMEEEANGGFHIIDASNLELCDTGHPVNLAYGSAAGKVSINGAEEVDVDTVTTAQCINANLACDPNAEVTASELFAYGDSEAEAPDNMTLYGFQQGESAWEDIGGSGNAISLGTSESAAEHDFYFGLSLVPSGNGALTGTLKVSATVV